MVNAGSRLLGAGLLFSLCAVTAAPADAAGTERGEPTADVVRAMTSVMTEFVDRRTRALLLTGAARPFTRTLGALTGESTAVATAERAALAELAGRAGVLAEWGQTYQDGHSTVTVERIAVDRSGLVGVDAVEHTVLRFRTPASPRPETSSWESRRRFVFEPAGGRWVLRSQRRLEAGPADVNEPTGATVAESRAALAGLPRPVPGGPTMAPSATRVRKGAVAAYAERYYRRYNPKYRSYHGKGGDCTNFVSQAMRAGGWSHDTGWYRSAENWWYNSYNESRTWVNVGMWYQFAAVHSKRTKRLRHPRDLRTGDVLQVDFDGDGGKDHSMIVSRYDGQPRLTYHSESRYRKPLSELLAAHPRARWLPHRT